MVLLQGRYNCLDLLSYLKFSSEWAIQIVLEIAHFNLWPILIPRKLLISVSQTVVREPFGARKEFGIVRFPGDSMMYVIIIFNVF